MAPGWDTAATPSFSTPLFFYCLLICWKASLRHCAWAHEYSVSGAPHHRRGDAVLTSRSDRPEGVAPLLEVTLTPYPILSLPKHLPFRM